jgi:hypothetical protein
VRTTHRQGTLSVRMHWSTSQWLVMLQSGSPLALSQAPCHATHVKAMLAVTYEVTLPGLHPPSGELAVDNNSPFNFFKLTGLTWVDWATLVGFLLTIVGFGVTLWQLHRTQTAIEAVNYERSRINRRTASGRLTTESFPSLNRLYGKARSAAEENNRQRLREALERWSGKCSEALEQLALMQEQETSSRRESADDDRAAKAVINQFISTQGKVREAIWKIDKGTEISELREDVQYALKSMSECNDQMRGLRERDRYLRRASLWR